MNLELKKYIQEQLAAGVSKSDIYTALLTSNWHTEQIDKVFSDLERDATISSESAEANPEGELVATIDRPNAPRPTLLVAGLGVCYYTSQQSWPGVLF